MPQVSTVLDLHPPSPPGVPLLLARLVDDAALFPPSRASVVDTVKAHLAARRAPHAGVIGFLICPISRLSALVSALRKARPARPVALSLVADTGLGGLPKAISTALDNAKLLDLRMIEVPAPSDVDATWLVQLTEFVPDDVVRVVEPRRGRPEWLTGVRRVAEAGCWPKLRCGGSSVESFPSVDEVSEFLAITTGTGTPFKATAGLHHAIRGVHTLTAEENAPSELMHGFLNVLLASALAFKGRDRETVLGLLEETSRSAFRFNDSGVKWRGLHTSIEMLKRVREEFAISFGSCSFEEPLAELRSLGLI